MHFQANHIIAEISVLKEFQIVSTASLSHRESSLFREKQIKQILIDIR
jgi:hypothetical protein